MAEQGNLMPELSKETAADVLKTCIKLRGTDNFEKTVNEVIADIRNMCEARHCCLLLVDFQTRRCSMLAQAYGDNARRITMNHWADEEHFRLVTTWEYVVGKDNCLMVKDEDDMLYVKEKNPEWYDSLIRAQVKSIFLLPLRSRGELLGYIWATNFELANAARIRETLELTAFFLASELANYQLLERLHTLSTMDILTGVRNRNAMNARMDELCKAEEGSTLGVVFADLNGLKRVNDVEGHHAGDLLLKNAAMELQNVFLGGEIYRAGGDEFLVLLPRITQERLLKEVESFKDSKASNGRVCFAVGYAFLEDSRNVAKAMKMADELMYADKKAYYEKHPELKRK